MLYTKEISLEGTETNSDNMENSGGYFKRVPLLKLTISTSIKLLKENDDSMEKGDKNNLLEDMSDELPTISEYKTPKRFE